MSEMSTTAVVLAAGKGTRMHSAKPKVLQTILNEPMLYYVYAALAPLFRENILTVIGHGAEMVESAFPEKKDSFVIQEEQLGTGHALQVAWDAVKKNGATHCLVINGDTPLVTVEALDRLTSVTGCCDLAFMTITPKDVGTFGRVVRDEDRRITSIVEAKDFDMNIHGPITGEVNAGIYLLKIETIEPLLDALKNENASGEYYITDLVALAVERGLSVDGVQCGDDISLMGINSPRELVVAENTLRRQTVDELIDAGVLIHNPDTVTIGPGVTVEPGAEIFGHCEIYGASYVKAGARLGSYTYITDSTFETGCNVKQFCHIEGAGVGPDCVVGPYARLRPGAVLKRGARVGNFVEIKKAVLGEGAKASHLTYLGDADVGAGANIGAGTITCNYDGKNKFTTVIGEGAFIGSNTALVAPVSVGRDALVGAGSTITKDVPEAGGAIARGKQININRRLKKSD
ncbi:bifunctional UDP-N-acetylglucosamine diphosphorylase/glucosamine-1-phosphate N-acetyltransferase GlmU [Pseudodesulfovibrio piezophilus]|uniref:Bifunctional protein GlmU n=1 Tax=Pseudodesulfovibrio piezophilus (strain DSM 21447 / JCM 15486 / C1TLV30) TaxID=1322246 RepID=M1WRW3_PSEP2|nr:bifunctional UDP-N-acetylglucosamine diphosphorylase/glucosamine-1-phosphate N-acetyltransferase GlmU [Pseudodesulfovibrio piezophilus]CCH49804.1 Bifunctional protein glmU [Includes: UDP-N-acetylglucosamine pyrophosphorylase; Glucosamine-1-phosphate N-acetyltransferase] [Pseudodesulfovibrio piezophilus C1TLV30]